MRWLQLLQHADKHFNIELACWNPSVGDTATERLQQAILACIPDDVPKTMVEVKNALCRLRDGPLVTFAGRG